MKMLIHIDSTHALVCVVLVLSVSKELTRAKKNCVVFVQTRTLQIQVDKSAMKMDMHQVHVHVCIRNKISNILLDKSLQDPVR